MYKVDYHHHTKFSFDGKDGLMDICKAAIENKLNEICFTEHFDVDPKDVSYGVLDYNKYHNEIEKCKMMFKGQLIIRRGLEIGEPHLKEYIDNLKEELSKMSLDFIIGSVHNINSVKLRLTMLGKSKHEIYLDYFNELLEMVKVADIDVIGHLDLMKRYAYVDNGNYIFKEYESIIEDILKIAVDRNIGVELNTSGLRNEVNEIYPKAEVLKLYRRLGGDIITIGSDSHSIKDCSANCTIAYDLARECGFKYIYTFEKRKPIEHKI